MYLVTGGTEGWDGQFTLSSTEVLTKGGVSWSYVSELPRAMVGMKAVSLDNNILLTGNIT